MVYYRFSGYIGADLDVIWCIYGLLNGLVKGKEGKGKIKGKAKGKGKGKGKARERETLSQNQSKPSLDCQKVCHKHSRCRSLVGLQRF